MALEVEGGGSLFLLVQADVAPRRGLIQALGALRAMSPIDEFENLSVAATKRLAETFNAPDVIPFGSAALALIAAHPDLRHAFAQKLLGCVLEPEHCDPWFLQFCVHGLRWPELKTAFQSMHSRALAENDWNTIPNLAKTLAAFDESWEDAKDFYGVYFHRERT